MLIVSRVASRRTMNIDPLNAAIRFSFAIVPR
jgi:hypothetical protein